MKNIDELKKIAVLIDADNAQLTKLKPILAEISTHGHIIVKRAYGDWSSQVLKNWKSELNELAIQPIQQFAYTTGKNATDAAMIIDAMDLLYTAKYDAFVLVSSDSDFTMLASRLRTSEIYVFGVGEQKTPKSFRNACDDFMFTEYLGATQPAEPGTSKITTSEEHEITKIETAPKGTNTTDTPATESVRNGNIEAISSLLDLAYDKYADEGGWVNVSYAGDFIKRSMPDFDSRSFGFSKLTGLIASLPKKYEMKKYKGKGTTNIIAYKKKRSA